MRQFVSRATSRGADVDDVVHDVFLTAARAADRYDGRENARPFLLGVAAQLIRRRRRSVGRFLKALSAFAEAPHETPRTPEQEAGAAEDKQRFERALAEMNEEKREQARNNPDFENLWYKPTFRRLFGYQ